MSATLEITTKNSNKITISLSEFFIYVKDNYPEYFDIESWEQFEEELGSDEIKYLIEEYQNILNVVDYKVNLTN